MCSVLRKGLCASIYYWCCCTLYSVDAVSCSGRASTTHRNMHVSYHITAVYPYTGMSGTPYLAYTV